MESPKKILIVGEKITGKTSLIKVFKNYEQFTDSNKDSTTGGSQGISPVVGGITPDNASPKKDIGLVSSNINGSNDIFKGLSK